MIALESGFCEYQGTPVHEFLAYLRRMISPCALITFGTKISNQIDLYSNQPCFKHLAEFAKFLPLIPHSNSYCESIFSTIRKIFTVGRHKLGKDTTQGHASTSVYTEKTSIRKYLLGILIPKIYIFVKKNLACYE